MHVVYITEIYGPGPIFLSPAVRVSLHLL